MEASFYAAQWLLSLFCSDIATDVALKFIDFFLIYDIKIVFKFTLALLKLIESKILKLRCDGILTLLKKVVKELPVNEVIE